MQQGNLLASQRKSNFTEMLLHIILDLSSAGLHKFIHYIRKIAKNKKSVIKLLIINQVSNYTSIVLKLLCKNTYKIGDLLNIYSSFYEITTG